MTLGNVVLLSSGETSQTGGLVIRRASASLPKGFRIAILETPAGFELNSTQVAQQVANSIILRMGDFSPKIAVIPARRKGTPFSTDSPEILDPLPVADLVYMGAGSPTYAVRQLRNSLAWQEVLACWQQGAVLILASAAAVAMGLFTLPVYEIFKAGEDPEWKPGLDLFGALGWKLAVVSHWNNAEGGEQLDTSRCFVGRERFDALARQLPAGTTVLGLDEHTAVLFDWKSGKGFVEGKSTITILRDEHEKIHAAGVEFPLEELGDYRIPSNPFGVEKGVWEEISNRRAANRSAAIPPPEVLALLQERERIRKEGDYAKADLLRIEIERLGWKVMDTPHGTELRPLQKG
jgi:cyanophycinase-like exopeptidase